MGIPNFENRTLFHGDNLEFLRGLNSESVDLIATDPPFNKSKDFHATPDSLAAGASFPDRWRWEQDVQQEWVDSLEDDWPEVWRFINGVKESGQRDMAAFLCWLGVRLLECRRILKPTGSLYLHIDHTAHAYAKALLDGIFGRENFRNEIVWNYGGRGGKAVGRQFPRNHDSILAYSKDEHRHTYSPDYLPVKHPVKALPRHIRIGSDGRPYKTAPRGNYTDQSVAQLRAEGRIHETRNGNIRIKYFLKREGDFVLEPALVGDVWDTIPDMMHAPKIERLGYPTQKPLALYERIIRAASNRGDWVLDPHCGCATTPVAAERLGRQWIGMDIWPGAYQMVLDRLNAEKQIWRPEDVRLITRPPTRTDDGVTASAYLAQIEGRPAQRPRFSKEEMKAILIRQWSAVCWGCGFEPPNGDDRHFDLDHNWPKAAGGHNELDNRAILCRPCNGRKSNKLTLDGLRTANKRDGYWYGSPTIDQRIPLQLAVAWAREYLEKAGK